jgi:hypothetical protein
MLSKDTSVERNMKLIRLTWLKIEPNPISRVLGLAGEMVTHC